MEPLTQAAVELDAAVASLRAVSGMNHTSYAHNAQCFADAERYLAKAGAYFEEAGRSDFVARLPDQLPNPRRLALQGTRLREKRWAGEVCVELAQLRAELAAELPALEAATRPNWFDAEWWARTRASPAFWAFVVLWNLAFVLLWMRYGR